MNALIQAAQAAGQVCDVLRLPNGDEAWVCHHGAHVLSWRTADGRERLYLSPQTVWDGHTAIRGGVPVCFPQFNQQGPLAKHGFARNRTWQRMHIQAPAPDQAELVMQLTSDASTRALWPHDFVLTLRVSLSPAQLRLTLTVHNTGDASFQFTGALHTYLAVNDMAHTRLHGLSDAPMRFNQEVDQVFPAAQTNLVVYDGDARITVSQSPSWPEHVVWNPGAARCATIGDLPAEGYRHMLCIEAAAVHHPIALAPHAQWVGWQTCRV